MATWQDVVRGGRRVARALAGPGPVSALTVALGSCVALPGLLGVAGACLGVVAAGALAARRARSPAFIAADEGLGQGFLAVLDHEGRLARALGSAAPLAPAVVAQLGARARGIGEAALRLSRLERRLVETPSLVELDARAKELDGKARAATDPEARRHLQAAAETRRRTRAAVQGARALQERVRAELAHMAAVLEHLTVEVVALGRSGEPTRAAAALEELVDDAEALERCVRELEAGAAPEPPPAHRAAREPGELTGGEALRLAAAAAAGDGHVDPTEREVLGRLARVGGLEPAVARAVVQGEVALARVLAPGAERPEQPLAAGAVFEQLLRAAAADGVVSPDERALVLGSAQALGLTREQCEEAQRRVRAGTSR